MKQKKKRGRTPTGVRERILDMAEKHFAEVGYNATSLRTIAAAANIQLSHIYYYFSSKQDLYDAVFQRHTDVINSRRREALKEFAQKERADMATLVADLVYPWLRYATSGQPSAQRYTRMMARLINSDDKASTELIRKHFDPIANEFIEAFGQVLPDVDRRTLAWGYILSVGTVLGSLANAPRIGRLDGPKARAVDGEELERVLLPFLVGGWEALIRRRHP